MNNSILAAKNYYATYDVENRIKQDRAHFVEFISSMNIIEKYISGTTTAIDIGCGTGNYSIVLAKKCQEVLSIDLMDNLLEVLQHKIKEEKLNNISYLCADVLNLPQLINKKYELILCMGPLYHLNKPRDRLACYNNLKKIATDNAVFIFSYITTFAYLAKALKGKSRFSQAFKLMEYEHFYSSPFYFSSPTFMEKDLTKNSFEIIEHVALDPISSFHVDKINSLSPEKYQDFIDALLKNHNCPQLLSLSSHNMIVSKIKRNI